MILQVSANRVHPYILSDNLFERLFVVRDIRSVMALHVSGHRPSQAEFATAKFVVMVLRDILVLDDRNDQQSVRLPP